MTAPAPLSNINPFVEIRTRLGDSPHDHARRLNVSTYTLWAAENGMVKHPLALLDALEALGHDRREIRRQYDAWRQEDSRARFGVQTGVA